MCRNVARGVVAQMLPQTRCLNSGAVTNLEPSFQIHTSKKFTRNFRNVLPFDFVVFASSPHAPYVVFRELSLQGHDDVMMSSLNLPDKSIENALVTSSWRHEVPTNFANATSDNSPEFFLCLSLS